MTSPEQRNLLKGFVFDRVLNEDAKTRSASLLGHFDVDVGEKEAALLLIEKTHFSTQFYENIGAEGNKSSLSRCSSLGSNDVYNWLLGWTGDSIDTTSATITATSSEHNVEKDAAIQSKEKDAHVKVTLIRPATQAHISKYSEQLKVMITETPELYRTIVEPWIKSQAIERIQWVYNILDKKKEAETILYERAGKEEGYIVSIVLLSFFSVKYFGATC